MANKYYRGFNKLFKFGKSAGEDTGRTINTIVGVPPSVGKLKKIQEGKKKITDVIDTYASGADDKLKKEFRKGSKKSLDKISKVYKEKKNGGRIGRKLGTPNPRKSNVQKIKETFGPKKKVPNKFKGFSKLPEKVQEKIDAKLAKKV
jgi:hypothetical protein